MGQITLEEAAQAVLDHMVRVHGEPEWVTPLPGGFVSDPYWSPKGVMIDVEVLMLLRQALNDRLAEVQRASTLAER